MATRSLQVVIAGDAKGLADALSGADGALGQFGSKVGSVGTAAVAGFAAMGVAAVGVGGALYAIGGQFDDAFDRIRVGTGATGAELAGLEESFKAVVSTVPTDFDTASAAITGLNQRLGLTGQPLEALTAQLVNLSRITDTDVGANVEQVTRVFGDWSISTENQAGSLDALFRAAQATGTTVDGLSATMVQFGGPLRQLGFGFEQSAALIGQFEAQGVNTELVLGSMRQALGRMARAGEDPVETFRRVTEEIENAGSAGEANALALELFGARAGPDMAAAIREGRFEIGDLLDTVANGTETINGAAADTADFSEKWQLLKNKVLVGLQPIAEKVFGAVGDAMDRIIPVVEQVIAVFQEDGLGGVFAYLGDELEAAWPTIRRTLGNLAEAFWQWVQDVTPPLLRALGDLLEQLGAWVWNTGLPALREKLARWTEAFFAWAQEAIPPALRELGRLLGQVGTWILDEGLPLLAEKLLEWGQAFVAWIGPMILPLLGELGKLVLELNKWIITEALPAIAGKLLEWAWAFVKWVATDAVPGLLRALGGLIVDVGRWVVSEGLPRFVQWGAEMAGGLVDKVMEFLRGLPGRMLETLGEVGSAALQIGQKIMSSLGEGISGIVGRVGGIASDLANAFRDALGGLWNSVARRIEGFMQSGVDALDVVLGPTINFGDDVTRGLLPRFHAGGTYRAPNPGGEGLALLRDGEFVSSAAHASSGPMVVVLQMDGREFGRATVSSLNEYARSAGVITLPIRYGGAA